MPGVDMPVHLFTYGTLIWPVILHKVVKHKYHARPGFLNGFRRVKVRNQVYPALIKAAKYRISGMIYFNIDLEDLQQLDIFEGPMYNRIKVSPTLLSGEVISAHTYVCNDNYLSEVSPLDDWFPQNFLDSDKQIFVKKFAGWERRKNV